MVRRSTFNRDGESSILSSSTNETIWPAPCVPFVQWIRTERYERSDSGSSPERDTRVCGVVAERQRRLTVYEDQMGSTPIHFATIDKCRGVAKSGLKRSALTREIESSNLSSPSNMFCVIFLM